VDETPGLALADLPKVSVQAMATTAQDDAAYLALADDRWSQSRIYRSDDQGQTWQSVGSRSDLAIQTLAVQPGDALVLYAGTGGGPMDTTRSLWRSQDGGQSWQPFYLSLPANPEGVVPAVTAIAIDPNRPAALYVGTAGQGVYRFEEGQVGYELVGSASLPAGHIQGLVMDSESHLYGLTNEGLFVLVGDVWQKLAALPEPPVSLVVAPTDPELLYAGGTSNGLYRSIDGGQSWQYASDGLGLAPGAALRITALVVDKQDPLHVMAATAYGLGSQLAAGGLYESRSGGHRWTKLTDLEAIVTQLNFHDGLIYAATAGGLERYQQPAEPGPGPSVTGWRWLSRLTGTQLLILALTIALAGLILVGRTQWLLGRGQAQGRRRVSSQ
jgi:photosystem II stability/assembly factor-like uncharacterized protein